MVGQDLTYQRVRFIGGIDNGRETERGCKRCSCLARPLCVAVVDRDDPRLLADVHQFLSPYQTFWRERILACNAIGMSRYQEARFPAAAKPPPEPEWQQTHNHDGQQANHQDPSALRHFILPE